jgi:transposase
MTQPKEPNAPYAAWVALDWADQKHDWALRAAGATRVEQGELSNTPEAVEEWACQLTQRFGADCRIALAIEQTRGAVVAMLSKYAHLVIYPVPPSMLANYRKSFYPSGAKSDPGDTGLLLEILEQHRERLRPLEPDTAETRLLQFLGEKRRDLVQERTRHVQQLQDWLKQVFPQVLFWFDEASSPLVGDLLLRWPRLEQLQKAKPKALREFFREHNCRSAERIEERIAAIAQAVPATRDEPLLETAEIMIQHLVHVLAQLRKSIGQMDQRLEQVAKAHPDYKIFSSFPGSGKVLTPRLIAAFGTNRERFESAFQMQCVSGIAPVTQSSGKQRWVHWRWACPKFLRQTFHEMALHSIGFSEWARAYYDEQRARGKSHHAAVRALAYKWIRILYRCWKDGVAYDERRYQKALFQRIQGRPLQNRLEDQAAAAAEKFGPTELKILWNKCAGFSRAVKISVVSA